jgi:cyanophycinase
VPKLLYLFGDQHNNFAETSRPFIEAAGGTCARVAVLTGGGEKAWLYVEGITAPWREWGVEVVTIGPDDPAEEPCEGMARALRECTGIFMCGGLTRNLERIYVHSHLGDIIRAMYGAGVPYAGVSSGALLAAEKCATWGGIVTTQDNQYYVLHSGAYDGVDGDTSLQLGEGLGLVTGCMMEPHFSERGGFPRLLTVMEWTGVKEGYGLDEPICLVIEDNVPKRVLGRGRLYHVTQHTPGKFEVEIHDPGEEL